VNVNADVPEEAVADDDAGEVADEIKDEVRLLFLVFYELFICFYLFKYFIYYNFKIQPDRVSHCNRLLKIWTSLLLA